MNNQEKNTYVKEQLTRALLEELKDKELKDISVSQLAEAAGVNRVSFYRSFKTKEDILTSWMHQTLTKWLEPYQEEEASALSGNAYILRLFQYLKNYDDIYMRLYERGLLNLLRQTMLELNDPKSARMNYEAYGAAFVVNGMYGWIEEWIARGMSDTPEAMYTFLESQKAV